MSSPLLINEPPLQVLPSLAKAIGLQEAIVLQQFHYWLGMSNNIHDGRKWIYNTFEQWSEQFPFWSVEALRKIVKSLRDQGLIEVKKLSPNTWDRTNFYAINYEALGAIRVAPVEAAKLTASSRNQDRFEAVNFAASKRSKVTPLITETTQETSQETTGGKRAQAQATAPAFPKLYDLVAEQSQATRLAAEQAAATQSEAAAMALEAAQAAAKAQSQAKAPAKAEKPARAAVARATEFPAGFTPNDTCIELAASLGVTLGGVDGELVRFEDYYVANGTKFKDWQAGLRTWIRNAAKFAKRDQKAASHVSRSAPAAETAYQRSMRERVQEFAPSIARQAPAERQRQQSAAEFFNTIEVPARTVGVLK